MRELPMTRHKVGYWTAVVGVTIGLAACGGNGSSQQSPGDDGKPRAGGTTLEPRAGGTLNFAVTDVTSSEKLDPALATTTNDTIYSASIFEGLTEADLEFTPVPALATEWEANDAGTEWTFKLREGVQFQDGSPFTARDVKYSLSRVLDKDLGSPGFALLDPVLSPDGIRVKDDHTVVFKLKQPNGILPVMLSQRHLKIVKDGTSEFTETTTIGTGPFKLDTWRAGESWAATKNEDYWRDGLPYLDRIEAVVIPDQATKVQSVVTGRNHFGDGIDFSLYPTVEGSDTAELKTLPYNQGFGIVVDRTQAPFDDPRVFEAIRLAQDREEILRGGIQGHGHVTGDIPVATDDAFFPENLSVEQDVEGAKRLLAEAGYEDGLTIELNTSAVAPGMVEVAQAFQQSVKEAGIEVEIKQASPASYYSDVWMQRPVFMDYFSHYHPIVALMLYYGKDAVWNESQYVDEKLNNMIAKALGTLDPDEQRVATQQAYEYAGKMQGYAMPVLGELAFVQKKIVNGVKLDYNNRLFFRETWLAK